MGKHGKASCANVQKKDSFFYHSVSRSFCRVARKIASKPRRKLTGKDFKKAESAGRRVVFINPEGTTQQCSRCGIVVPKTLADRVHNCPGCDLVLDRALNAAYNILKRSTVGHTGFEACEVAPKGVTVK